MRRKEIMCTPRYDLSCCFLYLFLGIEHKDTQSAIIAFTSSVLGDLQIRLDRTFSWVELFSVFYRSESESFSDNMENSCSLLGNNHSPHSRLIRNHQSSSLLWAKVSSGSDKARGRKCVRCMRLKQIDPSFKIQGQIYVGINKWRERESCMLWAEKKESDKLNTFIRQVEEMIKITTKEQ